ncbi:MAG TPA: hypothetical protein VG693_06715, partial [Actinomycetes bacterium]|nr:hypothetical protein [Actinomycetes bacterium]
MESFVIKGGQPLSGVIRPAGNKNAALPILAASLLADEPVVLRNVPHILDVETMLELVASTGATVERTGPNEVRIDPRGLRRASLDPALCTRIRASVLLAAPLLARTGRVRDSAGLSVAERRANLAGTFVRRRGVAPPPGALLVLVDDVLTSGATLSEAAAALAGTGPDGSPPVLAA